MSQIDFSTPGISPRWKLRKSAIRDSYKRDDRTLEQSSKIEIYNSRSDNTKNNYVSIPHMEYYIIGFDSFCAAIGLALDGKPWLEKLAFATAYSLFGSKLKFYSRYRFGLRFPDSPQKYRMMSIQQMTEALGCALLLGWTEDAVHQGYLVHAAINRGYNLALEYEEQHRRATAFMLRLFADWRGDVHHDWPPYGYDEPIYEAILATWHTPDPQALVPALLAACDRHTHEGRYDTNKTSFDFGYLGMVRTPLEILMVFRLRQMLGLENPVLDHPLMVPPFDRLPDPQPPYGVDALMQGTLTRLRQDWPDFDTALSLEALKQP